MIFVIVIVVLLCTYWSLLGVALYDELASANMPQVPEELSRVSKWVVDILEPLPDGP